MSTKTVLFLQLLLFNVLAYAEEVTIAVASNFADTMTEIVEEFEQVSGHRVNTVLGSSGRIFAQISNGAPFQVFLSADQEKALALLESGRAVAGSRFTYAIGRLALWSGNEDFVDSQGEVLRQGGFERMAIANPRLAPYGIAAFQVLENLGLADSAAAKIVQGENIAQTYQFVATGNVELGFVALSQIPRIRAQAQSRGSTVGGNERGSVWLVPESLHEPIRQDAVMLKRGESNQAAIELLQFLKSNSAREIITSHGYRTEAQ